MKIRTITYGISGLLTAPAAAQKELIKASQALGAASRFFNEAGWEVQTTRLSLAPVLKELDPAGRTNWLESFAIACQSTRIEFVSLGAYLGGELTDQEILTAIAAHPAFNLTTIIGQNGQVLPAGVKQAAATILSLAQATPDGLQNFRYAAIAHCPPGIPFFPASYQSGRAGEPPSLTLGLQMPDLAHAVISGLAAEIRANGPSVISEALAARLVKDLGPLQELAETFCRENGLQYGGIDLSLAPMGEDSVVAAFEAAGTLRFGEAGTLAFAAAITRGLQLAGATLKSSGYNGLMLPVLEDRVLGERVEQGLVDVSKILAFSAVCGTGLDVIPLPGDLAVWQLENLLYDVAALSARYHKPLSARLFPVPGKQSGEKTTFVNPYLTNTVIMSL
ncbi:MAG: hypothetical protein JWP00_1766 [Chloroflexi bacterium]|nr:hypothetical protein [Chloroflexota bacterium]